MERPEYLYADPVYRKKVIILVLIIALGGTLILTLLTPLFNDYHTHQKPEIALYIIRYTLLVLLIIPVMFTFYMIRFAVSTIKQGQFPPSGTKVIKDTRILYDNAAKSRARFLIALSVILFIMCLVMAGFLFIFISMIK